MPRGAKPGAVKPLLVERGEAYAVIPIEVVDDLYLFLLRVTEGVEPSQQDAMRLQAWLRAYLAQQA